MGRAGVALKEDAGKILIQDMDRWGPAKKAGMQIGDVLIRINETSVQGLALADVVALARGPVGSTVTFSILRNGAPLVFPIQRADLTPGSTGIFMTPGQPVMFVRKGSPGKLAGIREGDRILQVDDVDLTKLPPASVNPLLNPPAGVQFQLTVSRPGAKDPLIFHVTSAPTLDIDQWNRKADQLLYEKKYDEAAKYVQMAADKGDPHSQFKLAQFYSTGNGVAQDRQEAMRLMKKAADQDYAPAFELIARYYRDGYGVKADIKEAFEWYQKGADHGDVLCHDMLGYLYRTGQGTKQDINKSFEQYKIAVDMGSPTALVDLGMFYMYGYVVQRNIPEALRLFQKGWDQGVASAAINMGHIYEQGMDVPVDFAEAAKWYRRAAEKGFKEAEEALSKLPQVNFLSNEIQPPELRPGEKLQVNSILEVSGLNEGSAVNITLERQLMFQDKPLFSTPKTETQQLTNGQHTIHFEFSVPSSAASGAYKFITTLHAMGADTTRETLFVIR